MNIRTIHAIAAVVLAALVSGCGGGQEAAWQHAKETNTIAAYQAYVQDYQDSPHAGEAQDRIRALQAAALWEQTRKAETVEAYRQFLDQFPNSSEAEQARTRLGELERNNEWAGLRDSTDIDALKAFAQKYGDYAVGREAQQRITELEEARAREQARLDKERQLAEEATHTHRVQLAARRSEQGARDGIATLEKRLATTLEGVKLEIKQSGNFYLIRTEPLKQADARALCGRLRARNQDCLVVSR